MNTADLGFKLQVLGRSPAFGSDGTPRHVFYPVAGALLALGAPGGLLLLRWFGSDPADLSSWIASELVRDEATYAYLTISTSAVFIALGYVLGSIADRLQSIAITDPLTGLFNRRHFKSRLEQEVLRAQRYGTPLSLLIVDVDHLKQINDLRGHAAGDAAIVEVATTVREQLRGTDIGARYGGDEFAVLLPHTNASEGLLIAERLREHLHSVTVSIGISELAPCADGSELELLLSADEALYLAKSDGRDCARLDPLSYNRHSIPPKPRMLS